MLLSLFFAVLPLIQGVQDIVDWLPKNESAVEAMTEESIATFETQLNQFLAIVPEERSFENTIRFLDFFRGDLEQTRVALEALMQIHPEKSLRDSLDRAVKKIDKIQSNAAAAHPEMFQAFLDAQKNSAHLTKEEKYFLDQLLMGCKREGMQLPDEQRHRAAQLKQEIAALERLFQRQIAEDNSTLLVSKEELAGLDPEWIAAREQKEADVYRLACDAPTFTTVMARCSDRKTRQAFFELYTNRAFPQNEEVVQQLISKRDQLAKLLGFSSFAQYALSSQMAESPENVRAFLKRVKEKAALKSAQEFALVTQELPEGVRLNDTGKLERFDELFAFATYKKKHFDLDPAQVAIYFPLSSTLEGLMHIYEQFFHLEIREVPHTLPIPDLKAMEIRDQNKQLLGIVLLDLFPRPGKCTHTGVHYSLIRAFSPPDGRHYPAASLIIGNFTPSLMNHSEVVTLFHEFGHAIHNILGRNNFLAFCGTRVKRDFVELPSQLLEGWMWDPAILKKISSHYITGEPLSDPMITSMLQARDFGMGNQTERNCFLSELSLSFFDEGQDKNPTELVHQIWKRELPYSYCADTNHFHTSWWHVSSYGPMYYSYLWSQVFACDLFEKIHQEGLLNPASGTAYTRAILSKGGSQDPNEMLYEYLGRAPSLDPFFDQLGVR